MKEIAVWTAVITQTVFDPGWWNTATPGDVADMWQQATRWPDPDHGPATPTVFDHAVIRIDRELSDRAGLDATQILALATLQELEQEPDERRRCPSTGRH